MVALRTGERVRGSIMGVYNPVTDGQTWIRVDATPLFDPGAATPREVYATFLDITAETEARRALRDSEARFHRLFDAMAEGVAYCRMLYDAEGRPDDFVYESVNPAFARLTGLADVQGRRATEVFPTLKAETPGLLETYGRVARTGEPAEFDIDFTPLDVLLHVKAYQPEPDHFVAVFENTTKLKKAVATLRRRESELSTLVDTIPEVTFAIDREYRLVTANAAFVAAIVAAHGKAHREGRLGPGLGVPGGVQPAVARLLRPRALRGSVRRRDDRPDGRRRAHHGEPPQTDARRRGRRGRGRGPLPRCHRAAEPPGGAAPERGAAAVDHGHDARRLPDHRPGGTLHVPQSGGRGACPAAAGGAYRPQAEGRVPGHRGHGGLPPDRRQYDRGHDRAHGGRVHVPGRQRGLVRPRDPAAARGRPHPVHRHHGAGADGEGATREREDSRHRRAHRRRRELALRHGRRAWPPGRPGCSRSSGSSARRTSWGGRRWTSLPSSPAGSTRRTARPSPKPPSAP